MTTTVELKEPDPRDKLLYYFMLLSGGMSSGAFLHNQLKKWIRQYGEPTPEKIATWRSRLGITIDVMKPLPHKRPPLSERSRPPSDPKDRTFLLFPLTKYQVF